MAAQVIQFPSGVKTSALLAANVPPRRTLDTQQQAHRIVAQIEREIATQAYQRSQMKFQLAPPPLVIEMETPSTVARRIFHAILAFARSA